MTIDLLASAEGHRAAALCGLDKESQAALGQFFTPVAAAALIASMPRLPESGMIRLLDPGAGSGMLAAALIARVLSERPEVSVHVVAVECDEMVLPHLRATLDEVKAAGGGRVTTEIVETDYVLAASSGTDARLRDFDLVIQNPPYGKIGVSSPHRVAMKRAGVDAPNLYAAFIALSIAALRRGGQGRVREGSIGCPGRHRGRAREDA
jgi:adenine-specific DNA-methyltransferase